MGRQMVKAKSMRTIYICMVCFSVLVLAGCTGQDENNNKEKDAVAIVTGAVSQDDFSKVVNVGGTLRGDFQSSIFSKVTGTITNIPVRVGQKVSAGDILVGLDKGGVQSQYKQAEARFINAEKQYRKMQALFDAGAISESRLDEVETQFRVARADFESAREAVEIDAPFDGMVVDIPVRVGDEVDPLTKVVEIANINALRLVLDVPTSQVGELKRGQTVTVSSPLIDGATMTGEVISIADAANTDTRSFEVDCRFDNPSRGFSPGVFVVASIETKILNDALLVPNDALMYRSGKTLIYAVAADTVAMIPVEVLAGGDSLTAVSGNLAANQRIVIVGQKNLTPGSKVREAGK